MSYQIPLSVARKLYYEGGQMNELAAMRDDGDSGVSGCRWRFIHESAIDEIMAEELEGNPELIGMFNADFLAAVTGWPEEIIVSGQKGEQWEAIGQGVIDNDCIRGEHGLAREYAKADGYGHHFAHYDFETHELADGWYGFRID